MHRPRLRSYSDGDFLVAVATEAEQHTACVGLLRVLRTVELLRIVLELLGVGLLRIVKQLHGNAVSINAGSCRIRQTLDEGDFSLQIVCALGHRPEAAA